MTRIRLQTISPECPLTLTERGRQAVRLAFAGMKHKEIAQVLGCSRSQVSRMVCSEPGRALMEELHRETDRHFIRAAAIAPLLRMSGLRSPGV